MPKIHRVLRISLNGSQCWVKFGQALKAVENRASKWINPTTIHDLTLAESIALRKEDAKNAEPIPFAEIPGLRYEPTQPNQASTRQSYQLAAQANRFCIEHA